MPLNITMLGVGSIGFTRRLMQDILAVPGGWRDELRSRPPFPGF
ncbi:MAG: hypothetical protein WCH98_00020 [Verrucomicrobiota bacterium]